MIFHHWWSILIQNECNLKARRHPPVSNFHPWQWSSPESHKNPATPWFDIIYRPDCPPVRRLSRCRGTVILVSSTKSIIGAFRFCASRPGGNEIINRLFARNSTMGNMGNITRFRCNKISFSSPIFTERGMMVTYIYIYNVQSKWKWIVSAII